MRPTAEGKRYILAAVLISVAALNTGNNLIYLIFALMSSIFVIAYIMLRVNLSRLEVKVSVNRPVFAEEETVISLRVRNRKRYMPSYSLRVCVEHAVAPVFFSHVPAGKDVSQGLLIEFPKRGNHSFGDMSVMSGYPFVLFSGSAKVIVEGEILVYPKLREVESFLRDTMAASEGGPARWLGHGDELYSIREQRQGDDWKRVHWKLSAKMSQLFVKEYAEYHVRKISVLLDNLLPSNPDLFERAVSLAASICKYYLDLGYPVRGISCRKVVPFGSGEEQLFRILDILAVMQEEDVWDCPAASDTEGFFVLVLKSRNSLLRQHVSADCLEIYADGL